MPLKPVDDRKRVLVPARLRQVPAQFSWVDQALVQKHLIDRLEARAAALYLFLVTVADAQGLSYYGGRSLAQRLHLEPEALVAARRQLIAADLIAYEAPLYQVLAVPGAIAPVPRQPHTRPEPRHAAGLVHLGELLAAWRQKS